MENKREVRQFLNILYSYYFVSIQMFLEGSYPLMLRGTSALEIQGWLLLVVLTGPYVVVPENKLESMKCKASIFLWFNF